MRGIYTTITDLRRKVFVEVARLAYEGGDYSRIEELPFKIIPGETASYRESIFLERAIVGERLRLTIGLPLRKITEHAQLSEGIEGSAITEKYYDPPLINIIKFACNCCPEKSTKVTNGCQGCLAHPCSVVCPKSAISIIKGKALINSEMCINCGKCVEVCPYNAIVKQERPCSLACGVNAISSDSLGRAEIDYKKCVSCGMCLVNCPFGAIADKGQIFQIIHALKSEVKVYAAIAPAFVGQFGKDLPPEKIKAAFKQLGFEDVIEVAIGADLCTLDEARDFIEKVPNKQPFMATSCCPSWSMMAKQEFPELKAYISMSLTPMVLTGRLIKKQHPGSKVVFVGPCAAKKLEASRKSIRSDIDFVITFEEIMGMFEAKGIDFSSIEEMVPFTDSTAEGRNYAVSGGVANAVADSVRNMQPAREVKVVTAQGLTECKKMLQIAQAGKYDGCLLEGMACPGGCLGGAGTLQPLNKATAAITQYSTSADKKIAEENAYKAILSELE